MALRASWEAGSNVTLKRKSRVPLNIDVTSVAKIERLPGIVLYFENKLNIFRFKLKF